MLENNYNKLDSNEQLLMQQVAVNPSYNKLLYLEKETIEQQILSFYRIDGESDSQTLSKLESLQKQRELINALLDLNKTILSSI